MVNWTTTWYTPGKGLDADAIADQIVDMAVQSVALEESRRGRFSEPQSIIDGLRQDLDHLSRIIGSTDPSRSTD